MSPQAEVMLIAGVYTNPVYARPPWDHRTSHGRPFLPASPFHLAQARLHGLRQEEAVSVAQAARMAGVSPRFIRRCVELGSIRTAVPTLIPVSELRAAGLLPLTEED